MKLKSLVASLSLTVAAGTALAADQSIDLSTGAASFVGTGPILSGGDDVITFTGLAAGVYNFMLTLSGQNMTLSSASVNGVLGTVMNTNIPMLPPMPPAIVNFAYVVGTQSPDFALTLVGSAGNGAAYSGEMTVSAVPEPESYALFLAGLGALGFMARRRRQQA